MLYQDLTEALWEMEDSLNEGEWPVQGVALLAQHRMWGGTLAAKWQGSFFSPVEQLQAYEAVAAGSLSLALILTQHDGACQLLQSGDNEELAGRVLPRLAVGECLATIGISQLTTSHQGGSPALQAVPNEDGYLLNGFMPWVTAAAQADFNVAGAVLPDGQQLLVCLTTQSPGLHINAPFQLLALDSSWTSRVRCENVQVKPAMVVRGPAEAVLARRAPVKSLTVTIVGMGVAKRVLRQCRDLVRKEDGLGESVVSEAERRWAILRDSLFRAVEQGGAPPEQARAFRVEANDILARLAPTLLLLAKGTGYTQPHWAQRYVREVHFFQVWSATQEVRAASLERLWGLEH